MPKPKAICIEDLSAADDASRYLRCVALAGRQPGLQVDRQGDLLWRSDEELACELWVSADERLICYRPDGAAPLTVQRSGRSLEVPETKPVVLLDQDQLEVGGRGLRIHIHGEAVGIHPPSPLPVQAPPRPSSLGGVAQSAAATAAALALGLSLGAAGCKSGPKEIEVRAEPPSMPEPEPDMKASKPDLKINKPDMIVKKSTTNPPIEVRVAPPEPPIRPAPPPPPPKKDKKKKVKKPPVKSDKSKQ